MQPIVKEIGDLVVHRPSCHNVVVGWEPFARAGAPGCGCCDCS